MNAATVLHILQQKRMGDSSGNRMLTGRFSQKYDPMTFRNFFSPHQEKKKSLASPKIRLTLSFEKLSKS